MRLSVLHASRPDAGERKTRRPKPREPETDIMSTISSITGTSSAANPYLQNMTSALEGNFGQTVKDFQAIGAALQSNNLASAKSALTALQKDLPANMQSSSGQIFGKNTQASTDYQKLTSALQAGDLTGAQKSFAALESDLKISSTGSASSSSSFSSTFNNLLAQFNITQ
jgi:hypothetical protein